nr:hypothetical protein CFP56_37256 [Quercus suber]
MQFDVTVLRDSDHLRATRCPDMYLELDVSASNLASRSKDVLPRSLDLKLPRSVPWRGVANAGDLTLIHGAKLPDHSVPRRVPKICRRVGQVGLTPEGYMLQATFDLTATVIAKTCIHTKELSMRADGEASPDADVLNGQENLETVMMEMLFLMISLRTPALKLVLRLAAFCPCLCPIYSRRLSLDRRIPPEEAPNEASNRRLYDSLLAKSDQEVGRRAFGYARVVDENGHEDTLAQIKLLGRRHKPGASISEVRSSELKYISGTRIPTEVVNMYVHMPSTEVRFWAEPVSRDGTSAVHVVTSRLCRHQLHGYSPVGGAATSQHKVKHAYDIHEPNSKCVSLQPMLRLRGKLASLVTLISRSRKLGLAVQFDCARNGHAHR